MQPLIAVTSDVRQFDNNTWHGVPEIYLEAAISVAGVFPLTLPALGADRIDVVSLLQTVDGVIATGSKSNVHPELYGKEATAADGPYDPKRDSTTLPLLREALEQGVPVLAICRGMQELNVALGGTLATEIQEVRGNLDHRAVKSDFQEERFAIRQNIDITAGQSLERILGASQIKVNSLHRQAIGRLADGLQVEARAPDGVIEAVSVKGAKNFALGVQWHPEFWAKSERNSREIFKAFGDAVRARHAARTGTKLAAE